MSPSETCISLVLIFVVGPILHCWAPSRLTWLKPWWSGRDPGHIRTEIEAVGWIYQWLIIQGRAVGKLFAPLLVFFTRREGFPEQQPQPGLCDALYWSSVLGALALRSLTAMALRLSAGMQRKLGALRIARGEGLEQFGHSPASSHSDIGRMSVNGPQSLQR
jgi:hypothetical protein